MRIDRIIIKNFKGFEERSFDFPATIHRDKKQPKGSVHVLIGDNGAGKSTALDALAVAVGIWHVARPTAGWRAIRPEEARLVPKKDGDTVRFDPAHSPSITAHGQIDGKSVSWTRQNRAHSTKTSNAEAKEALAVVEALLKRSRDANERVTLPVLAYYDAGRAWNEGKARSLIFGAAMKKVSRFDAYFYCLEGRIRQKELNRWFLFESVEAFQRKRKREGLVAVEKAVLSCIPGATGLRFDGDREEIVLGVDGVEVPFYSLSDGQRSMLALVGDLAIKCVQLNPHLGKDSATKSPGIVLIDELDLHLHPNWQRQVVECLRGAFPEMQFICTTHSPFVVQSLRAGELISLDSQPLQQTSNLGVESIARGVMNVKRPDVSPRYEDMKEAARHFLVTLEKARKSPRQKLAAYKKELAKSIAPYSSNPAFQAFLELKQEAALGGRSANGVKKLK